MKKPFFLFTAGVLLIGASCTSTDTTDNTSTTTSTASEITSAEELAIREAASTNAETPTIGSEINDITFMTTAASSNQLEIQLSKIALQKAKNPKVKEFAQMIVEHHTEASRELKTIAMQAGTPLTDAMIPQHQEVLSDLKNYTGSGFDEKYMDLMEDAHKDDIAMYESKTMNAENASLKSYASRLLPTLKEHYRMANTIEDSVD
jgi:putative membrane protein